MSACYDLGGVSIAVRCADSSVADLMDSRLRSLERDAVESADIDVEIRGPGADRGWLTGPSGPGRPIYDSPGLPVDYYDGVDELFVDYGGHVSLACSPAKGLINLAITGSDPGDPILATHPLFTIAFLETMKRFGRYSLHAAGLSLNGQGILVPGSSGAGKSTLSVTLARAGFDFLSDDTVFLAASDDGIRVSGFPDEVDVTETTVSMFPELLHLVGQPLLPGRDKHSFRVEEVFSVASLAACRPAALVFPHVVDVSSPQLDPLAPSEALLELMPNLLATDPAATQTHLDVLAELVRSVPCFTFRPGSDLDAAAARIAELVT
jgi:hypothetical protein